MKKQSLPLSRVYRLVETGPVVLLTTAARGHANVMPMSWHCMMEFEPPLIGCVISANNHSYELLMKSRECVINIPTAELAKQVVACGNRSGRRFDKFEAFGLTPVPAAEVGAPLIDECYASLECRLVDRRLANRYNFLILEVVKAWIDRSQSDPHTLHHRGRGFFMVAGETIRLPSRKK